MITTKQLQNQKHGCFKYCCTGTLYVADNLGVTNATIGLLVVLKQMHWVSLVDYNSTEIHPY